jgi:hypothetical protein
MKIYAVVDNVDLGYHVEFACISKDKAQEALDVKIKQKYDYAIKQQVLRGFDYEKAKEIVDEGFWTTYELIEIEVEE